MSLPVFDSLVPFGNEMKKNHFILDVSSAADSVYETVNIIIFNNLPHRTAGLSSTMAHLVQH